MYDNGLLKHFEDNSTSGGFLNVGREGFIKNLDTIISKTSKCIVGDHSFYSKTHNSNGTLNKLQADAEILLSQLYAKAGINSSIYLPAESHGGKFLLCDDVEKSNVLLACDFLSKRFQSSRQRVRPFLSSDKHGINPSRCLTLHAMQQQTKMRILDTASFNTDRHLANFFYTLERRASESREQNDEDKSMAGQIMDYFKSLKPDKADDIVAIDFESSGKNVAKMQNGYKYGDMFDGYMNDFQRGLMKRPEMIDEFKNNEALAELIDKEDFAEVIGSLNPSEVAQDIKATIGYEVDSGFVDTLSKSYDDMAEILAQ